MNTKYDKEQNKDQDNNSTIPSIGNGETPEDSTCQNEASKSTPILKGLSVFERIMICLNFLLFVATAILAYFNWNLARDSTFQAKIAERNMIVSNAPYFSFGKINSTKLVANDSCKVSRTYTNVGKTPALNVRVLIITGFAGTSTEMYDTIAIPENSVITSHETVAPKEVDTLYQSVFIDSIRFKEIYSRKRVFVFKIVFQYNDVFDHRYRHMKMAEFDPKVGRFAPTYIGNNYTQVY